MSTDPLDRFKADLGRALVAYAERLPAEPPPAPGLAAAPATTTAPARPPWAAHRTGRRLAGLGLAGALAAVVATALAVSPGSVTSPPAATAAAMFRSAAQVVLRQPADALGPGRYWYVDLRSVYGQPQARYFRDRIWTARDGAGLDRSTGLGGTHPTARRLRPSARPFAFGFQHLSYAQLRALPTSPAQLDALLRMTAASQQPGVLRQFNDASLLRGASGRTYILFEMIRDAFAEPTSPPLRAALYRVAAQLPFHADGPMRDHVGRVGTGISFVLGSMRFRMIIEPATGQLLETQRIVLPGAARGWGQRASRLYARYTYVAARIVGGLAPAR